MQAPYNPPEIFCDSVVELPNPANEQRLPSFESVAGKMHFTQFQPYLQDDLYRKPVESLQPLKSKKNPYPMSPHEIRTIANDRERRRTQNLNKAFEELRKCIFSHSADNNLKKNLKCAKVVTLKLAAIHIDDLHKKLFNRLAADNQIPEVSLPQNYQLQQPVMHPQ